MKAATLMVWACKARATTAAMASATKTKNTSPGQNSNGCLPCSKPAWFGTAIEEQHVGKSVAGVQPLLLDHALPGT